MPQFVPSAFPTRNSNSSDAHSVVSQASALEEMAHEIRQPLSVIESLAYYLEMTSTDEVRAAHLRRIQAMVVQANRVLRTACGDC
jgi:signal transduction histidine kinase